MFNKMQMEMLSKEQLEKGYTLLDINFKGNTTKSITFKQEDILLSYIEGLTLDEIAEENNINPSGVREHLLRVNRKIKFLLGEGNGLISVTTQPPGVVTKKQFNTVTLQPQYENIDYKTINWSKLTPKEQIVLYNLLHKAKA